MRNPFSRGTPKTELSAEQIEIQNVKLGALTVLVGALALAGAFALPSHNRAMRELQFGLEMGGGAVLIKGMAQGLEAGDRWDKILEAERRQKTD